MTMTVAVVAKRNWTEESCGILNLAEKLMFKQVIMSKSRSKIEKG